MTATILFATKNPGKYAEFVAAFHKFSPQTSIISLADLDYQIPNCIETGTTFEQNALLKARHTRHHLHENDKNLIIIADDSGMEIEALNGEPGVFTRRWNGHVRELFFVPELNMMFHEVRELPKLKRNGYSLGHEVAVEKCASVIQENLFDSV